jgi:hypothetical protein
MHCHRNDFHKQYNNNSAKITVHNSVFRNAYKLDVDRDVEMTFTAGMGSSGTAELCFKAKNKSGETRIVSGVFTAIAAYYTGVLADTVHRSTKILTLQAHKGNSATNLHKYTS